MLHDTNRMRTLTDEELLRIAYAEQDDLTTTALEKELLRRFDYYSSKSDLMEVIEDEGITADDIAKLVDLPLCFDQMPSLLRVLSDHDLTAAGNLRAALNCIKAAQEAIKDAGDSPDTVTLTQPLIDQLMEIDL